MARTRATAVVFKDNFLLMMHRHNNGEEYFVLPGGGVDDGESVEDAVLRELREETSITATLKDRLLDFVDSRGDTHVVYSCEYVSGEPRLETDSIEAAITTDTQTYEPKWVDVDDISSLTIYPTEEKEFLLTYVK